MAYLKENKQTEVINLPRGAGETTYLLYTSEFSNIPILCALKATKEYLIDEAKSLGIRIPDPITVDEFRFDKRPSNVLVDEELCVFQEFVGKTTIVGLTLSDKENSGQVYQLDDSGAEVKRINDLP